MAGNELFVETFPGVEVIGHPDTTKGLRAFTEPYIAKTLPEVTRRLDELRRSPATEATKKEMDTLEWRFEAVSARPVAPTLEVADVLVIQRGQRRIEVRHLGAANTAGVASGDMAITPVQFAFYSSPSAWSDTLEKLATIGADVWVPGHGPAQRDAVFIRDLQAMLRTLVTQAGGKRLREDWPADVRRAVPAPGDRKRVRGDDRQKIGRGAAPGLRSAVSGPAR